VLGQARADVARDCFWQHGTRQTRPERLAGAGRLSATIHASKTHHTTACVYRASQTTHEHAANVLTNSRTKLQVTTMMLLSLYAARRKAHKDNISNNARTFLLILWLTIHTRRQMKLKSSLRFFPSISTDNI